MRRGTTESPAPKEHPPVVISLTPFFQLPKDKFDLVSMLPSGIKIAIHPTSEIISDSLRNSHAWERHISNAIIGALRDHPEAQFVDIGANIGVHSLQAAKLGRKVFAVEANPRNCELLSQSVKENGWKDRVTIINHAVDNKRGKEVLVVNPRNIGSSYVSSVRDFIESNTKLMEINSIFFDDLLTIIKYKTLIMKMDIEGAENHALETAHKFFDTLKIPVVFMEWTLGDKVRSHRASEELIRFFTSRNYDPYDVLTPKKLLSTSSHGNRQMNIVWKLKNNSLTN